MSNGELRTWIEINKKAIKNNVHAFRSIVDKKCQLMGIVKSNAYGHSLLDFAQELEKLGIEWLGVDSMVEAESLRKSGIKSNILILGHTLPKKIYSAVNNNCSLTISSFEGLGFLVKSASHFKKPPRIHLKIDTGMHRQGFFVSDLKKVVSLLKKNKGKIKVEGIYTHFAAAKNPSFPKDTCEQINEFRKAVAILKSAGFNPIRHAAATSGTIIFPESHFDVVRIGIGLYGLWPSAETEAAFKNKIKLRPALTWKTVVSEGKNLEKGHRIGYDFTEEVGVNSRVAILPVGYWHGYPRSLSSIGEAIIRGKSAKILGRVSMDMIVVNVTGIKGVKTGNEVLLLGKNITADRLAYLSGTSNYEFVTRINPLIKRIYI
jgi:alanine racemase